MFFNKKRQILIKFVRLSAFGTKKAPKMHFQGKNFYLYKLNMVEEDLVTYLAVKAFVFLAEMLEEVY